MISNCNLIFCDSYFLTGIQYLSKNNCRQKYDAIPYSIVHLRWRIRIAHLDGIKTLRLIIMQRYGNAVRFSCYSSVPIFSFCFINFRSLHAQTHTVTHTQCDHFQQFYNRRNIKVHVPIIRWLHCDTHTHSHTHTHTQSHTHTHTHTQSHTYTVTHTHAHTHSHTHNHAHTHAQSHTHTVTHKRTHTHTHIHTYTHILYVCMCVCVTI